MTRKLAAFGNLNYYKFLCLWFVCHINVAISLSKKPLYIVATIVSLLWVIVLRYHITMMCNCAALWHHHGMSQYCNIQQYNHSMTQCCTITLLWYVTVSYHNIAMVCRTTGMKNYHCMLSPLYPRAEMQCNCVIYGCMYGPYSYVISWFPVALSVSNKKLTVFWITLWLAVRVFEWNL